MTAPVIDDVVSTAELAWENEGGRLRPARHDGAGDERTGRPPRPDGRPGNRADLDG